MYIVFVNKFKFMFFFQFFFSTRKIYWAICSKQGYNNTFLMNETKTLILIINTSMHLQKKSEKSDYFIAVKMPQLPPFKNESSRAVDYPNHQPP